MKKTDLKIYPLGGVGEIGSNMTVFETENHLCIIDYGILFPYDDFFDINYLIVDTQNINADKKITLFITHGHEDHIGAVHHFLKEFPKTKIVAPKFAKVLIEKKLEQRKMSKFITEYRENDIFSFDQFDLHPIHVTHSIPYTHGIVFKSKDKQFATLFISDFKYDLNPLFEEPFNTQKIKDLFKDVPMRLAMLDSTNILNPGKTASESDTSKDLEEIISAKKRTFVTLFSSNIYRIKNILEIAKKHNKKITTIGRSIGNYLDAAEQSGLINRADYKLKEFDSINNYNDPNLLLIVTGSQGEHLGATRRIVSGNQKHITLNDKDQFIFSSKPIPGNEKKIYKLYNDLTLTGCEIISFKEKMIHASGHPCQEDLKELITEIDPTDYIPIHGEIYFLREHIKFIKANFPHIKPHFLTNYDGIEIKDNKINHFSISPVDPHLVHGRDIIIEREKVSERRKLACNGLVIISINHKTKNIAFQTKGLPLEVDTYKPRLVDLVEFQAFTELRNRDHDYIIEEIRIKVRNSYNHFLGYKPITIVQMV
jgi:ribonuclease J